MKNITFDKYNVAIISLIVTTIIGLFYFNTNLFIVTNHNDFGEYFIRAEYWSEGIFVWWAGSDKLLSLVEYIAIIFSDKRDFFDIYNNINSLMTILMLISIYFFLTNKNSFNIDFKIRVLTVLFVFTLPFFVLKGRTVDQSYLLGIMLLLWVSVYHIKIISSVIALFVLTARPEGIMIIPLFLLAIFIDKANRKKIIINFVVFLFILFLYKLFDSYSSLEKYQEYRLLGERYFSLFGENFFQSLLAITTNIVLIPFDFYVLAIAVLKSYMYFIFFVIGTVVSIRDKKYYLYFSIIILYLFMIVGLEGLNFFNYNWNYMKNNVAYFFPMIPPPSSSWLGVPIVNHERYLLFLYPFIGIFVIRGIVHIIEKIHIYIGLNQLKQQNIAVILVIWIFSSVNILQFMQGKFSLPPASLTKATLHLREHKNTVFNSVIIYNYCDGSTGSTLNVFSVLSGITNIYTKSCKGSSVWIKGHPENKLIQQVYEADEVFKVNKSLNFKFEHGIVNYKFTVTNQKDINSLFKKPNRYAIKKLGIDFLISTRKLSLPTLKLIAVVDNYKIYSTHNFH